MNRSEEHLEISEYVMSKKLIATSQELILTSSALIEELEKNLRLCKLLTSGLLQSK